MTGIVFSVIAVFEIKRCSNGGSDQANHNQELQVVGHFKALC